MHFTAVRARFATPWHATSCFKNLPGMPRQVMRTLAMEPSPATKKRPRVTALPSEPVNGSNVETLLDLGAELNAAVDEIINLDAGIDHTVIVKIGGKLCDLKAKHRKKWLDVRAALSQRNFSERKIAYYMRAYREREIFAKFANLGFPTSTINEIIAKSVPAQAVDEILALAKPGNLPARNKVEAIIYKHKGKAYKKNHKQPPEGTHICPTCNGNGVLTEDEWIKFTSGVKQ